ncbi:MBL fold metallo-hydrolase [uncultured Pluralibacter sp.]|uniref:MBL fold metallo-hydrolase n=1 Tax=uncultured Pluralibacter sp. TaxID=1490864 RepID=UPI00261DBCBD|nr:MBL fold metallo-hydrolase [uncultured Pluralibacter sp.]
MTIKITVLLENRRRGARLLAKPGLSLLVEDGEKRILFDTGPDDSAARNAAQMNIDLASVDAVVLSHGHYDHCGGIDSLPAGMTVICHPAIADERHAALPLPGGGLRIKKLSRNVNYARHKTVCTRAPLPVSAATLWSGEIAVDSPKAYGLLNPRGNKPDYIIDEGVLIHRSRRGLIIITGCGHRGLINIVKHCQKITGVDRIYAVIGGFHLRSASPLAIVKIRRFLKAQHTELIIGCHCTGLWGQLWLAGPGARTLKTGDVIRLGEDELTPE